MDEHTDVQFKSLSRVGIMGGTFDPIHLGHLVTAEAARSEFKLDKVIYVPSGQPPHKKGLHVTDKKRRYLMTFLAVSANPYFEVSRAEIERPGETYTIDTVRYFKKNMALGSELFFITGADAIFEILSWKNVDELFELCTFIAATRPGYNLGGLRKKLSTELKGRQLEKIIPIEVPAMAISSTDIRERVKKGRTIKYLLPEPVENYIHKKNLYK